MSPERSRSSPLEALTRFLEGWGFPTFLIAAFVFATALLGLILVLPTEHTALEEFARDFKVWCYGYDPATGSFNWAYIVGMLTSPLLLAAFTAMVWWEPLRRVFREAPRRTLRAIGPAVLLVVGLAAGIGVLQIGGSADAQSQLEFPAKRLRTEIPAPSFELVDHEGEPVSLESLRGRVVMVTSVYASCAMACPRIMGQAKRVLGELTPAERREITVLGITMDPENDDRATLADMAASHGVGAPGFRLATGEPDEVNRALDELGVARERDPETGIIDHANLFLLVDRGGRVAYRFSLGERQERWLVEALRLLVAEDLPRG